VKDTPAQISGPRTHTEMLPLKYQVLKLFNSYILLITEMEVKADSDNI